MEHRISKGCVFMAVSLLYFNFNIYALHFTWNYINNMKESLIRYNS